MFINKIFFFSTGNYSSICTPLMNRGCPLNLSVLPHPQTLGCSALVCVSSEPPQRSEEPSG